MAERFEHLLEDEYLWYVSYGSNIYKERFLAYIEGKEYRSRKYIGCRNKDLPRESKPYVINGRLYYSRSSETWNGSAVAFLDSSSDELVLGRAYLITKGQFEDLWRMERGNKEISDTKWYNSLVELDDLDDYPAFTFTYNGIYNNKHASEEYMNVIKSGLNEIYVGFDEIINEYVKTPSDSNVQKAIREKYSCFINGEDSLGVETVRSINYNFNGDVPQPVPQPVSINGLRRYRRDLSVRDGALRRDRSKWY